MTLSPNLSPDAKQSSPLVSPLLNDPSCIRADDEEEVKRKVRRIKLVLSLFSLMCCDKSGSFLLVATSGACLDRVSYKSNLLLRSGVLLQWNSQLHCLIGEKISRWQKEKEQCWACCGSIQPRLSSLSLLGTPLGASGCGSRKCSLWATACSVQLGVFGSGPSSQQKHKGASHPKLLSEVECLSEPGCSGCLLAHPLLCCWVTGASFCPSVAVFFLLSLEHMRREKETLMALLESRSLCKEDFFSHCA